MTDPAVQAVTEALDDDFKRGNNGFIDNIIRMASRDKAQVAVDAYRRHVLASRPDAERWEPLRESIAAARRDGLTHFPFSEATASLLLAALADETAAREAAEAERERFNEETMEAQ